MIKGLRIATRCATVEQFVEAYHQICEETAIFIPNTQRPVDTVMQFRFDLQDGNPALLGVGTVIEELTTKYNRFDHVGIVVKLDRLSRTSTITFDQMLARARKKLVAPAPVYPRAMTVPIEVIGVPKSGRTTSAHVPIPIPTAVTSSTTRTKVVIAAPTPTKKRMDTVRIPAIILPTRKEPAAAPPIKPAVVASSNIDDGWDDAEPAAITATPPAAATAAVEVSIDFSDAVVTSVADIASAPVDQSITVVLEDHASVAAPAALAANVVEPDLFDTVTAVQGPDQLLLALMRRDDGRAAPAIIEAIGISEPTPPIIEALPTQPFVEDPYAAPEPMPLPPPPVTFPPIAVPAIDPASIRVVRRPWRWLAAAAFAALLCATAATTVFADRPVASVPPSATYFARSHEAPVAVTTARDQVASEPKQQPAGAVTPPTIVKSKPRARASSIERPSPRPQPATRPLRRPAAPKKCRNLGCL